MKCPFCGTDDYYVGLTAKETEGECKNYTCERFTEEYAVDSKILRFRWGQTEVAQPQEVRDTVEVTDDSGNVMMLVRSRYPGVLHIPTVNGVLRLRSHEVEIVPVKDDER